MLVFISPEDHIEKYLCFLCKVETQDYNTCETTVNCQELRIEIVIQCCFSS